MPTPQTAIMPDHCQAGIFIEADILNKEGIQAACCQALVELEKFQQLMPDASLGLTIGFGADFWHSLNHVDEGKELINFKSLGGGLAPATQHDLMFHIQSMHHHLNFALVQKVVMAFGQNIQVASETHGFRCLENRGLDGFVDGTENPQGDEIRSVAIIDDDQPDAGGSYVLLQKYQHHLRQWYRHSLAEQEESVARTKVDNIEFDDENRHPRSHLARVNLEENGEELEIVRRSLPYGTITGEHGLMFIAYCACLHNIQVQLAHMFGESEDGQTDLLLERLSTAVSGAYYFAPCVERLKNL